MLKKSRIVLFLLLSLPAMIWSQQRNYTPYPMMIDVGKFSMNMNKQMGEGGLQSQFSWMLTGDDRAKTETFFYPADEYQSNMLYQIFNPLVLDANGIRDEYGNLQSMYTRGGALTNPGFTDWAMEVRRYRPPSVIVDGVELTPPYRWYVDPNLKSDIKLEFEDVCGQFGIRSHVEIYAFSNPYLADFFIWKATQKFTGEIKLPRQASTSRDSLPDQTITFWWPIAFSFGPTKAGERAVLGGFAFEGEDDLDNWLKRKSQLVTGRSRDSLYVAYYYDADSPLASDYPQVGSSDDMGDPDRINGHLYSPQICGYTLLHADKSPTDVSDDNTQPYALPHATIVGDLWGRRDVGLLATYRGDDSRGRFPPDAISAGLASSPEKGPMRFITTGPYSLTKNRAQGRYDSISFVVAVGAGSIGWNAADSIGKLWYTKQLTDAQKDAFILQGRDTLFQNLDRANWAWDRLSRGLAIASPPPPPDIVVTSGPDIITVTWSYPDPSYFKEPSTGVDDWQAWRVYRKQGAYYVSDPNDQRSGAVWELVYETTNRNITTYVDRNIRRGVDYYYAVTAVDNGTQNAANVVPNAMLESSRFSNRSQLPAASFKPGLDQSNMVRVVPNPATVAAGAMGFPGTPNKILFVNLPIQCKIKIYTETGDFVKEIQHYGTGDHEWDQRTDNNQYVMPGIYIVVITEAKDKNDKALDNQFVKFVLIR
jgi:hypothetical protein